MATNVPVTGATPITIKISIGESIKKLKLPLSDLVPDILFSKVRSLTPLQPGQQRYRYLIYNKLTHLPAPWTFSHPLRQRSHLRTLFGLSRRFRSPSTRRRRCLQDPTASRQGQTEAPPQSDCKARAGRTRSRNEQDR